MAKSLNAKLVGDGMAYPAYYTGLPVDLRDRITGIAKRAKRRNRGLWKVDVSLSGTRIAGESDLEKAAQWPKLFRRLTSFFKSGGTELAGFDSWLRSSGKDDDLWLISRGELGNLHDIFEVNGSDIRMLFSPDDVVTVPG